MDENTTEPQIAGVDAQLQLVSALAADNKTVIEGLRRTHIPQHVGMAAAARALGVDLPRVLIAQLQGELSSGELAKRWEAALARSGGEQSGSATVTALATLLVEQAKATGRYVAVRAEEWAADAFRLEGQATALEDQAQRLARAHEGISRSREEAKIQEARQEERRQQRDKGEPPSPTTEAAEDKA